MTDDQTKKKSSLRTAGCVEILAPAGSYASFRAALAAGADAVYAGGPKFGARAYADNFTEEELIRAIREAHLFDRRFYLTVNTLLKEDEIGELYEYLMPLYENGLDAVIVQDPGVVEYVRKHFPGLDIHASTQMTITGTLGASFMESQGVTRVVPARELSLEEIRRIHEETELEIECFVHGALCYCYSGQCLLSSMIGGRSGNRGQCAQPCRLPYTVKGEKKYFLSPKDICTLEIIPDLIEAGIDSFKIEGRMKKPEYVAAVTSMYKKYTDLYFEKGREGFRVLPEDRAMLMDLYNRGGSSEGYYKQHNSREMMALERPNHAGVPAVKVRFQKGREVHGTVLTDLHHGDVLEITGGKGNHTLGNPLARGEKISFLVQKGVHLEQGMILNRVRNDSLIRSMHERYVDTMPRRGVSGTLTLTVASPAFLTVTCMDRDDRMHTYTAQTEECVQYAQSRPLDEERIRAQMRKTGNSEFFFDALDIYADENIFLPIQQLNLLRRAALDGLREVILSGYGRQGKEQAEEQIEEQWEAAQEICGHAADAWDAWNPRFSVLAETAGQLAAVRDFLRESSADLGRVYVDMDLVGQEGLEELIRDIADTGCEVFLAMPYIFRSEGRAYHADTAGIFSNPSLSGVLIRNLEEYEFLRRSGFDKKIILDHNLYVFNQYGKAFWRTCGITDFTAPLELNARELGMLGIREAELTVYGCLPLMVTAQCLVKTSDRCTKIPSVTMLTDRYANPFPVKNVCSECFNVIYNTHPLYLGMHCEEIRRLAPAMLRLQLSIETEKEAKAVLHQVIGAFTGDAGCAIPEYEYTQGHFKRGIL